MTEQKRRWYVGWQNGGVFIIDQPPFPAKGHDRDSLKDVNIIANVYSVYDAEDIVEAHNKDV